MEERENHVPYLGERLRAHLCRAAQIMYICYISLTADTRVYARLLEALVGIVTQLRACSCHEELIG